ncbi:hypothetical protein V5O48_001998 [Marasmius crinis-equi]|uniref:Rhodopsin domain-containing protein n=1 Tax=Marasmius crinis-equi TaxID=585013 RepID=A0ABR3FX12_9AGAR
MIGVSVFMAGILIFTDDPKTHIRPVKVAAYYMIDNGFYCVIWFSRASIFLTLVRLAFGTFRTILVSCVGLAFITYAILCAQVFWTCESQLGWKDQVVAQCMLGKGVAIAQLITDCLFDTMLILSPVYLLRDLKVKHQDLKIRLIAVFSSTVATTAFSLAHAWAIIEDRGALEFMLASIEVFISLIVVNLTVIVSWLFKINDDSTPMDPSQHMNTFLRKRLSSGPRPHNTTLGALTELDFACTTLKGSVLEDQAPENHISVYLQMENFSFRERSRSTPGSSPSRPKPHPLQTTRSESAVNLRLSTKQ